MTPSTPAPGPDSAVQVEAHPRERRLRQAVLLTLTGLALSAMANLGAGQLRNAAILFAATAAHAVALHWVCRGHVARGVGTMLFTLTLMATAFIVLNGGARDTALMLFPSILFFAGIFGSRRMLLALLGLMLAVVTGVVAGQMAGWITGYVPAPNVTTLVHLSLILLVSAASVWLVTTDLHRALAMLRAENARVLSSRAELEHMVRHDALTGLPNRVLARDRFEQAVAAALRHGHRVAVLCIDLDHFKTINDSLGHPAGDELLCQAGRRVQAQVRRGDTVCRLGGDEFLVLLTDIGDADAAAGVAQKVLAILAEPFAVAGTEAILGASMGIAMAPDDGQRFDDVLKKVDIAMYQAKAEGGGRLRFFDRDMQASVLEHSAMLAAMRAGLPRGEFMLHFQPQHCLRSGRIVGAEALCRWRHPDHGLIGPGRFIPVAERSGFIVELGAWVLHEACQRAVEWLPHADPRFRISVNLSPVQIRRGDVESVVRAALDRSGLPADRLELELTESMLIEDSREFTATLQRLRDLGVHFAIDDFGTGYSNLVYLKRFEVGRLKIDQSFVRRLTQDAQDAAIVTAIVQMAASLRLTTLAEGVEDDATRARLQALGCDSAQGYLWSPGVPAEQFSALLLGAEGRPPRLAPARVVPAREPLTLA